MSEEGLLMNFRQAYVLVLFHEIYLSQNLFDARTIWICCRNCSFVLVLDVGYLEMIGMYAIPILAFLTVRVA